MTTKHITTILARAAMTLALAMVINATASAQETGGGGAQPGGGYTLTLIPNYAGGTGTDDYNVTTVTLPTLTRAGFSFLGWAESSDGEVVYSGGQTITLTRNTILYAQWQIINGSFTLSAASLSPADFDENGYATLTVTATALVFQPRVSPYTNEDEFASSLNIIIFNNELENGTAYLPFSLYDMNHNGSVNGIGVDYTAAGQSLEIAIYIDPAVLAAAAPGTYTCDLLYHGYWNFHGETSKLLDGFIPLTLTVPARTANIPYLDKDGKQQTATDAIALVGNETNLAAGTYFVDTDITYDHTLTLDGDVTLILCDGKTMSIGESYSTGRIAGNGIDHNFEENLTICGQTEGTGKLEAYVTGGGNFAISALNIIINGGTVTANANGGESSAIYALFNVTINGGTVNATAESVGNAIAAIHADYGNVNINGGNVTAIGKAYGIYAQDGNVNINGGNVTARCTGNSYPNGGIYAAGTITLGWTTYADRIFANSYFAPEIYIAKPLATVGTNPSLIENADNGSLPLTINSKPLRPAAPYIDAQGTTQYCPDYTLLDGSEAELTAPGWYVADGTLNYIGHLNLGANGDYHLILADGCHMNIGTSGNPIINLGGIVSVVNTGDPATLALYGQSTAATMGNLCIYVSKSPGINVNDLTINGGNVTATANTNGGECSAIYAVLNVTINGGTVNATTNGIGTYAITSNIGNVTITGGNVTATVNSNDGYGICAVNGNITLDWTDATDRITASSYFVDGTVTVADGKFLTYGSGNLLSGTVADADALDALAGQTLSPAYHITLLDDADNTDALTAQRIDGVPQFVTLSGRTLYRDGTWNTLCLPFALSSFAGTPLDGATVKTLESTDFAVGTLTMTFSDDLTSIAAGTPWIVKWDSGTDIGNPRFGSVTVSNTAAADVDTTYADFKGTYAPLTYADEDKSILFLGAASTLYYPSGTAPASIGSCRSYFQLKNGLTAGEKSTTPDPSPGGEGSNGGEGSVKAFVLNFGDGGQTGIIGLTAGPSPAGEGGNMGEGSWYTLDGRRLQGKPTASGIYINNDKKIVVK